MPETALSVLVNALNRPVHFPKVDQTGSLFIAEPPTPFVSPRLETEEGDRAVLREGDHFDRGVCSDRQEHAGETIVSAARDPDPRPGKGARFGRIAP